MSLGIRRVNRDATLALAGPCAIHADSGIISADDACSISIETKPSLQSPKEPLKIAEL